jgi:hypothetical protein
MNTFVFMLRDEHEKGTWNSYIYTDYGKEISYRIENRQIVFTGVPSYVFVYNDHNRRTATVAEELNNRIASQYSTIYNINPTVYRSAEKTAQWAAFFRMVKAQYPQVWRQFMERISGRNLSLIFETPRYWLSGSGVE